MTSSKMTGGYTAAFANIQQVEEYLKTMRSFVPQDQTSWKTMLGSTRVRLLEKGEIQDQKEANCPESALTLMESQGDRAWGATLGNVERQLRSPKGPSENYDAVASLKVLEPVESSPERSLGKGSELTKVSAINGASARAKANGLPEPLKAGLEALSGLDLSRVEVNYNSSKPAKLNALAITQGTVIEVGPGQERHLPHEGWHVVQQMRHRINSTREIQGVAVNSDQGLEREADRMGALSERIGYKGMEYRRGSNPQNLPVAQRQMQAPSLAERAMPGVRLPENGAASRRTEPILKGQHPRGETLSARPVVQRKCTVNLRMGGQIWAGESAENHKYREADVAKEWQKWPKLNQKFTSSVQGKYIDNNGNEMTKQEAQQRQWDMRGPYHCAEPSAMAKALHNYRYNNNGRIPLADWQNADFHPRARNSKTGGSIPPCLVCRQWVQPLNALTRNLVGWAQGVNQADLKSQTRITNETQKKKVKGKAKTEYKKSINGNEMMVLQNELKDYGLAEEIYDTFVSVAIKKGIRVVEVNNVFSVDPSDEKHVPEQYARASKGLMRAWHGSAKVQTEAQKLQAAVQAAESRLDELADWVNKTVTDANSLRRIRRKSQL